MADNGRTLTWGDFRAEVIRSTGIALVKAPSITATQDTVATESTYAGLPIGFTHKAGITILDAFRICATRLSRAATACTVVHRYENCAGCGILYIWL